MWLPSLPLNTCDAMLHALFDHPRAKWREQPRQGHRHRIKEPRFLKDCRKLSPPGPMLGCNVTDQLLLCEVHLLFWGTRHSGRRCLTDPHGRTRGGAVSASRGQAQGGLALSGENLKKQY